jgi:hypothetical protein
MTSAMGFQNTAISSKASPTGFQNTAIPSKYFQPIPFAVIVNGERMNPAKDTRTPFLNDQVVKSLGLDARKIRNWALLELSDGQKALMLWKELVEVKKNDYPLAKKVYTAAMTSLAIAVEGYTLAGWKFEEAKERQEAIESYKTGIECFEAMSKNENLVFSLPNGWPVAYITEHNYSTRKVDLQSRIDELSGN